MEANLLIVEDEAPLRRSLQEYFEREGFCVAVADDGAAALAMLGQAGPILKILQRKGRKRRKGRQRFHW